MKEFLSNLWHYIRSPLGALIAIAVIGFFAYWVSVSTHAPKPLMYLSFGLMAVVLFVVLLTIVKHIPRTPGGIVLDAEYWRQKEMLKHMYGQKNKPRTKLKAERPQSLGTPNEVLSPPTDVEALPGGPTEVPDEEGNG